MTTKCLKTEGILVFTIIYCTQIFATRFLFISFFNDASGVQLISACWQAFDFYNSTADY